MEFLNNQTINYGDGARAEIILSSIWQPTRLCIDKRFLDKNSILIWIPFGQGDDGDRVQLCSDGGHRAGVGRQPGLGQGQGGRQRDEEVLHLQSDFLFYWKIISNIYCRCRYGVTDMFEPEDLLELKNIPKVTKSLAQLSKLVRIS